MINFRVPVKSLLAPLCILLTALGLSRNLKGQGNWEETFDAPSSNWQPIHFEGTPKGSFQIMEGNLSIDSEGVGFYGVYNIQPVKGHFYVVADYADDDNVALVLFHNKDGKPDPDNYTLIRVETRKGTVQAAVNDRQQGSKDVLDLTSSDIPHTDGHPDDGYVHLLEGDQISLPYRETDKRMKIFRHNGPNYFQYYYGVRKSFYGKEGADWMELRPSPNWMAEGSYYVGLVSTGGHAEFIGVQVRTPPLTDRDDTATGFALTQRDYHWSGYTGPAYVITFGEENPFREQDLKFVLWSEFNWVPHWYLTDQLAFSYEFVETWTGPDTDWDQTGCYEPMSDRLRVHSDVTVIEDNPVRKVLRWEYSLLNPNYEIPYNRGSQMPLVQETFTLYPDGIGVRHIRYYPKLDIDEVDWNEVSEPMLISGNNSNSTDFADNPPLTLYDLEGRSQELGKTNKFGYGSEVDEYPQVIAQVHFNKEHGLPDIIEVFSTDPSYPDTYPGLPLRFEHTWQSPDVILTHWPVNKRPYHGMAYSSARSVDPHVEVSHASLVSVGCREPDVYPANSHYEKYGRIDPSNGRTYLEWSFLIGPVAHRDFREATQRTRSWLIRDEHILADNAASEFKGVSFTEKAFVFRSVKDVAACDFTVNLPVLINPVIRVEDWSGSASVAVSINGTPLQQGAFRSWLKSDGDLLIFMHKTLKGNSEISIRDSSGIAMVSPGKNK
jgi:hypothetical protein